MLTRGDDVDAVGYMVRNTEFQAAECISLLQEECMPFCAV